MYPRPRHVVALLVVLSGLGASGAPAANREALKTTVLITRAFDGGFPNGPSRNAVISHDLRVASVIAYESDASNLVRGDSNRRRDVFALRRAAPYGTNGTPWRGGATELVSRGMGGAPANGHSYGAAVDGEPPSSPSCIAFVSQASNLVPHDTNGRPDAFVYDLASTRITRVSVDSKGRQAKGSTLLTSRRQRSMRSPPAVLRPM